MVSTDTNLKVLVVDDSVIYRSILKDILSSFHTNAEIQTASNGRMGLQKAELFQPDLILSDLEMPVVNGLEFVRLLKQKLPAIPVVIVSSLEKSTNPMAVEAMALGALDFIPKPQHGTIEENTKSLARELKLFVNIILTKKNSRLIKGDSSNSTKTPEGSIDVNRSDNNIAKASIGYSLHSYQQPRAVNQPPINPTHILIGVSTGGPNALTTIFPILSQIIECPILIVQHIPPHFAFVLAERLQKVAHIPVKIAEDGDLIYPGQILISPGGRHMIAQRYGSDLRIKTLDTPPLHGCKPSVDVLFNSFVDLGVDRIITVIMTGMGRDGADGVTRLRRQGQAYSIIQDEESSVVWGMPKAVYEAGQVDEILTLSEIGSRLKTIASSEGRCGLW